MREIAKSFGKFRRKLRGSRGSFSGSQFALRDQLELDGPPNAFPSGKNSPASSGAIQSVNFEFSK